MKIQSLKCWLMVFALAFCFGLTNQVSGQSSCPINFTGSAGNVLTSYIISYPNYPNSDATFSTVVQDTNEPVPMGTYLTWCVDADTIIDPSQGNTVPGTSYNGVLFPTCDTNLNNELPHNHPSSSYVSPAVWQQVNYILNHKNGAYFWDVQVAINDLVGGPPLGPSPPYPPFDSGIVQSLLTNASNNAASWVPQCGNVVGAVYVIQYQSGVLLTNPVQFLMLEVPYCQVSFTKCPTNLSLGCNPAPSSIPDCQNPVNTNLVSASSCCGNPVTITCQKSESSVGCVTFRFLIYTASDGYGNTASCMQTITWTNDTVAPVLLSAPTNSDFGCNPASLPTDAIVKAQVSYSAGCSTATIYVSHVDSGSPCAMSRIFAIFATDACGNVSATNYVTYTYRTDTVLPVISRVPASTNLGCNFTNLPTDGSVAASIVASDNCSLVSTNVTHVDTTNSYTVSRTFTINVTDGCGNVSTNSTVVYTWTPNHGPGITCAPDITISGTNTSPSVTGTPSVYDSCGNPIVCTNFTTTLTTNYLNLYCDQFSGSACALNGRAPDSADMGGFKWSAGSSWIATGTQAALTNCNANAYLPFQPTPGYLYQVSADIECVNGANTTPTSDWVALGFANGSTTTSMWHVANNPVGWQLARNSGNTGYSGQTFMGTGTAGGSNDGFFPTNITHYSIILDARPASPSAWTFTYLANGKVVTPTTAFGGSGPSISTVGFGLYCTGGAAGHVKNFCVGLGQIVVVTNNAPCANLSYTDTVASSTCAGTIRIVRTWSAWDNQGHTNTCAQNIYETIPLPPVKFAAATTNLGCAPATLPTDASVAALVVAYSGLVSTNVTHVDTTNTCYVTRTFTVTVKDSCGNTSPAATLVYSWINAVPAVSCWVSGPTNGLCLSPCAYTCWVTNNGNVPFSSCSVTVCGQTLTCPALNPGQGCSIPFSYTFLTKDLGLFNCFATANATAATTCAPTCSGYGSCQTTVCGTPSCKVVCSGPSSGLCYSPATYTCCITNNGTCPFAACLLTACGQNFACPSLKPGEGCTISVPHTFQLGELGLFNCLASVSAICTNSTVPSCTGQATCPTTVVGQPSCKVTCWGPSSGLCPSPATYYCAVTNNGSCPFTACTVSACGLNLPCPALQPGQGCVITIPHTFQLSELGLFNCLASVNANCTNSTAPTCAAQATCPTSVVGQPSCQVSCWGPSSGLCLSPATYFCAVTNNGTCPFSACTVSACGQSLSCPALQPGQGCVITIPHTFQVSELGSFSCLATVLANCSNSTAPTCSGASTCSTSVLGQPACKVTVTGAKSGFCLLPTTYTCCVTNTGTAPYSACKLTACGQTFNCPTLQPGQGCTIPVTYTFSLLNLGNFNCQAVALANCVYSTAPTCTASATCTTTVGQKSSGFGGLFGL